VSELVKGGAAKTQAVEQAANELGRSVEAVWKACKRRLRPTDMELWAQAKEALDAARERRESQRTGKDT
jgi:hypothetical protein